MECTAEYHSNQVINIRKSYKEAFLIESGLFHYVELIFWLHIWIWVFFFSSF